MPFLEMTQFSRTAFTEWLNSKDAEVPVAVEAELSPRLRGMRMLAGLLGRESGMEIIRQYGGLRNIRTIRVLHDKKADEWTLDFAVTTPLSDLARKLAEEEAENRRLKLALERAKEEAREEKEREDRRKVQEQRAASKRQREEHQRAIGKRPFQKT